MENNKVEKQKMEIRNKYLTDRNSGKNKNYLIFYDLFVSTYNCFYTS